MIPPSCPPRRWAFPVTPALGGGRQEPLGHGNTGAHLPPLYAPAAAPQPPPARVSGDRGGWQGLGSGFGPTDVSVLRPKLRPLPPLGEEDEDVAHERERVMQGATQGDVLVLRDLTKVSEECWVGGLPLGQ